MVSQIHSEKADWVFQLGKVYHQDHEKQQTQSRQMGGQ